jgi:4-hydroxy-4-methyl-2-oxoglutarate aldolase
MNLQKEIIDYCKRNRVSTTEVADAMGKSGVFTRVTPVTPNQYRIGPVRCVFTANESNYAVHEQVRDVQEGEVVIIFAHNCDGRAIIGDLISKYVLLYRGAVAIVVQGLLRDAAALKRDNYAIWAEGYHPLGCFNKVTDSYPVELEAEMRAKYEGGVAVCDDGGVTVIPPGSMLRKLQRIEMQEDIWFYCLDTLKWDTKKIVCDKAYLQETNLLSSVHLEQLDELSSPLDK